MSAGKLSVGSIAIGEIDAGPISIGKLVVESIQVDVSTGMIEARNLVVTIEVALSLDWSVSVNVPIAGDIGWSDTIDFGTLSATIRFGNVTAPGLRDLKLDLPRLAVSDIKALVGAIRNLELGALIAQQIAMKDVVAPQPEFSLSGLGLGSVNVAGASVPRATVGEVTVGDTRGDALPLGTVTIPGLSLPGASVGDITSDGFDLSADSAPYKFPADAGLLQVTLVATPSAEVAIDELRITNVATAASVGTITLDEVFLPYDVMGVKLSDLGIDSISLPSLEVS